MLIMRTPYPSDIIREQYGLIEHDLASINKTTKPRKIDFYEVFCAVLYILKNGCTLRALPHDFPNWKIVYYYFTVWAKKNGDGISALDYIQAKLVDLLRYESGRNPVPSMLIVDSKSVQNSDTEMEKGYDVGKKLLE